MEHNATTELVIQGALMVISLVTTIIGAYAKKWLETSAFSKKYNLDNEITERLLNNAVNYAEAIAKQKAIKGIEKKKLAQEYLDKISPDTVAKYGSQLDMMLERKVVQVINNK